MPTAYVTLAQIFPPEPFIRADLSQIRWPTHSSRASVRALSIMKTTSLTIAVLAGLLLAPGLIGANAKKKDAGDDKKAAPAATAPADAPAPAAAAAPLPETVAVVEGAPIKREELEKVFTQMAQQQGIPADAVPAEQKSMAYSNILNDMINEKLISKRAADEKVTDEEVGAMLDRIKQNFGSQEELEKQITSHGQTIAAVKEDIRNSLRSQHWIDSQIKDKTEVTDAEADAFYKANPDKFKQPERVRASHILVKVEADAKQPVIDEKQKQAQAIADRVKKGEDFAKLAAELSEDPTAKENKGDLDYFTKEQMVPEFSNAAFAMKKDEISNPVRSSFGFHVIKVTDHQQAGTVALEEVKPRLLAALKRQKQSQEFEKLVQSIREKADVKVNLPAPALPAGAPGVGAEAPAAAAPATAAPTAPAGK